MRGAAGFYLAWFVVLTWPAVLALRTHFLADRGDGLQNVWNLWWMREALCERHVSPLHTTLLQFPHGTTLLGHTLNPFNGLVAAPLLAVLPMPLVYNLLVVLAFVAGGVTAFLLARHVSGSRWGSLWGGFVFTFSSYHFAHAEGHLQLVSLQWLPLFLLAWLRWLEVPTVARAVAAAGSLVLVLLCDLYYTVFALAAAGLLATWRLARRAPAAPRAPGRARSALVFGALAGVTVGAWGVALVRAARRDPFLGAHDPAASAMDLLAPFVPGGHWRFAGWTRGFWAALPGNVHESSLYLGWGLLAALAWGAAHRDRVARPGAAAWVVIAVVFAVLALGPTLHVWGRPLPVPLPYRLLAWTVPPLALAGATARFFVMTTLACGVLLALVWPALRAGPLAGRRRPAAALALLLFETWPAPLPRTPPDVPGWVTALAAAPGEGGLVDLVDPPAVALYHQTVHGKPLAFGYVSRYPLSTVQASAPIRAETLALFAREPPDPAAAAALAARGFRWAVVPRQGAPLGFLDVRFADDAVVLYALGAR